MGIKKTLKKVFFYKTLALLPTPLRHALYRRQFARVPTEVPAGLTFELARTPEDLETAFRLLHDAYVEQGFIQPQPSGMRLILQHALPTTSILVAKHDERVVGTISVMRDTALGLPMEKVFDLGELRKKGQRVAELSCLAIHPDYRRKMGGHIFFPLTLFAAMFAQRCFGVDFLIWNLFPHHADFYNAIFGSRYLSHESKDYLGAPATAIQLDLAETIHFARRKYLGLPAERDLYSYSYVTEHAYFKYPARSDESINHPVLSPENILDFFSKRTNVLSNLSELEEQVMARYYPLGEYAKVLPFRKRARTSTEERRQRARWDSKLEAITTEGQAAKILDVSYEGCKAWIAADLAIGQTCELAIPLREDDLARISVSVVWKKAGGIYGFRLNSASEEWLQLVDREGQKLTALVA